MLNDVLVFLKNHLNNHLNAASGWVGGDSQEDKVVFIDGEKMDPIVFKLGAVSVLLINVEEENTLRAADAFASMSASGAPQKVNPEIRMNLYVLFVARFRQYDHGLAYLSAIIQHFQSHRTFDHTNAPDLSDRVEKLVMELLTLPFAEQNEVWNALRTTYHPSVLYKVKTLVFRDPGARSVVEVGEKVVKVD